MPIYPEEESKTTSSGRFDLSFNPRLPIVHSLSSTALAGLGFVKEGQHIVSGTQGTITTYRKGDDVVTFTGAIWLHNGVEVQFVEDLKMNK